MDNTILFEAPITFSVPCDLVDRHLNAPETELRLMLLLLRNANAAFRKEDLMTTLSVDEKRLEEAFQYWVKAGLLFRAAGKYSLQRPKLTASDFISYNPETVAQRLEGDPALQYLYKSAEESLKKPLTSSDASVILSLVDWCGLPADVVALLIRYGSENGKSLRQIAQTGIRWADDGIKTFEDAELLIRRETEKKNTVNRIAARFGILGTRAISEAEQKAFLKWKEELGYELNMIGAAYEEAIKNAGKYTYTYIDKVLTNWHAAGYKTPEEALAAPKPEQKTAKKSTRRPAANNPRKSATSAEAMDLGWEIIAGNDE
ncbi:MAG: DnaD domain protein [Clostridia bacterium]|nr:DnaD domain protein [Clostridia bacterium]